MFDIFSLQTMFLSDALKSEVMCINISCNCAGSMAKNYNMRLVLRQRFSEFFEEKVKKEHHRSLMMKMMALEVQLCILDQ